MDRLSEGRKKSEECKSGAAEDANSSEECIRAAGVECKKNANRAAKKNSSFVEKCKSSSQFYGTWQRALSVSLHLDVHAIEQSGEIRMFVESVVEVRGSGGVRAALRFERPRDGAAKCSLRLSSRRRIAAKITLWA